MLQEILKAANTIAKDHCITYVGTDHIMVVLMGQPAVRHALQKQGINLEKMQSDITATISPGPEREMMEYLPLSPRINKVIQYAKTYAMQHNRTEPNAFDLLNGLYKETEGTPAQILRLHNYTPIPEPLSLEETLTDNGFRRHKEWMYKGALNPANYVVKLSTPPEIMYCSSDPSLIKIALEARALFEKNGFEYTERPSLNEVLLSLNNGIGERSDLVAKILMLDPFSKK